MIQRLYKSLIEPRQQNEDLRNREVVLNALLIGTVCIVGAALLLMFAHYLVSDLHLLLVRILSLAVILLFMGTMYRMARAGHYHTPAYAILLVYSGLAIWTSTYWGVGAPFVVLLYGLVIVLFGILLGTQAMPFVTAAVILTVFGLRYLELHGPIHPNLENGSQSLSLGDTIGSCLLFGILALVSWLFTRQMERSLRRAHRAETALKRQKQLLEITVERRTRQLQAAQLERVQQMYRFAELGQLSTALLHDLANHLTALSLDIEGLEEKSRSRMLQRAKRSIRYIDDMVARVRDQLRGRAHIRPFNVSSEIEEIVSIMNHRAQNAGVRLNWEQPADKKSLRVRGEPIRFRQLMANLVSNAIDAYQPENTARREVLITAKSTADNVVITVNDWGRGISDNDRAKLFEPFYSTKKTGMVR